LLEVHAEGPGRVIVRFWRLTRARPTNIAAGTYAPGVPPGAAANPARPAAHRYGIRTM
jgi:hypothetical protein